MKYSLIKSKNGNVSITLLVVMTLFLCGVSLYTFVYYANSSLNEISGANSINELKFQQQFVERYILGMATELAEKFEITSKDKDFKEYSDNLKLAIENANKDYFSLFNMAVSFDSLEVIAEESSLTPKIILDFKGFSLSKKLNSKINGLISISIKEDLRLAISLG